MKSTRRFAIVALLTIAGSLLIFITEARHQTEEYPTHHRHRHHRHEVQQKLSNSISKNNYKFEMKPTFNDHENNENNKESYDIFNKNHKTINDNDNDDDDYDIFNDDNDDNDDENNKETYDIFNENNMNNKKHMKHKIINNNDDYIYDDDDDIDYHKNNDEYEMDDREYTSDQYYPKRKKLYFAKDLYIVRGYRRRLDPRLYRVNNYPDFIIKNPKSIKDSIEDYQKSSSLSSLPLYWSKKYENLKKQRHQNQHHQHRHQQIFYNRDNELYYQETRPINLHSIPILSSESDLKYNNKKHKNTTKNNINRKWQNIQLNDNDDDDDDEEDENKDDENEDNDTWLDELSDYDENNEKINIEKIDNQYKKKVPYKTYDEIIKVLRSNEPKIQNLSKLSASVKRGSRNIENKKYQKSNTLEISYNDSINNSNNINNKTINLNNKNTSIIDYQDQNKTRNIINNQLSQNINFDDKKLNSTTQLYPAITKSLDAKVNNNDDNYEKDDIDNDDDDDDNYTDGKNDTQTIVAYTVNDNEYETSVPTTTISPSTTMKIIEKLNTTVTPKTIRKLTAKKANNTSVYRAPVNKFKTEDGKLSQTQQNVKGADYNDVIRQNIRKLSLEGNCRWPKARVIPVRNVYPNPSTTYSPHCVILHKCSDDTGCCNNEQLTCAPIRSHPVEFYFYTESIGRDRSVEKLIFYNDTDCECKNKYTSLNGYEESHESNDNQQQITLQPQNITKLPKKKTCKCPSKFSAFIENGDCQCRCPKNNTSCDNLSIGRAYFSQDDKLCIQNETCALPNCKFGGYIKTHDRCPTRKDKFISIANVSIKNFPKNSSDFNFSKSKN